MTKRPDPSSLARGGLGVAPSCPEEQAGNVTEFSLAWPSTAKGSTHELAYNRDGGKTLWITGQNHDHLARVTLDGTAEFFPMPAGSGPHGMVFDAAGRFWVSLEFAGIVARVGEDGGIQEEIDIRLYAKGAKEPINPHPHGLGLGADGKTLWFTGKKTSTVGKINPDCSVEHFELPTIGAVPIYLAAGPDGNVWGTELVGNNIVKVTPDGGITEFTIPTPNSRPIAIVPGPDGQSMWFSEEAGNKVGRIDMDGAITEFPVPKTQDNVILGGLAFDGDGNLWTHGYVSRQSPTPDGPDYIIKLDKAIHSAAPGDLSRVPISYYRVPSRHTVFHRITQGPEGNIWFTELAVDKLGRLIP